MTQAAASTLSPQLETLAINTIRTLAIDAVQKANSGHPGLPMGAAPMAFALWTRHLRHNPHDIHWANRDRFILSAGHGSMLQYALLYLTGYDLTLDDIKQFRQWGSKSPGHPELGITPGISMTTGPLGQGAATSVGMALAEAYLANYYNRPEYTIVDHYTYVLVSDGDLMEGISTEAASLAGHWGLGKLIWLYDSNATTLDGHADMILTEDMGAKFEALGWHVQTVEDGMSVADVSAAIDGAKAVTDKPSLIICKTIIGFGSPNKAGSSESHGSPLGADEVRLTKEAYGWPQEDFYVPGEALELFREAVDNGAQWEGEWQALFDRYKAAYPELGEEFERGVREELPPGWDADIPVFPTEKPIATRVASGNVLNAIAQHIPTMIGGDADLAGSTRTLIKGAGNTGHLHPAERNIRFGVREHAMGAITNGLSLHGGIVKPYSATFLVFSDYMRPTLRLGALMETAPLYIFTHDSIGLGEDGPTHQPVEHVMSLRLIPGLLTFRPADANETAGAWRAAMLQQHKPCVLIFTRQDLPVLTLNGDGETGGRGIVDAVERGGYVLASNDDGNPQVILLGSGSEVHLAYEAYQQLSAEGVRARVVSLPCWELFEQQDEAYREQVLPRAVRARVAVEAGRTLGWERWTGLDGAIVGLDHFGASAPYKKLYQEFGITTEAVVAAARQVMGQG